MSQEDMISLAIAARERAYQPYSGFSVGCAVLSETGKLFTGCNVENASYGLSLCAERNALASMIAAGECRAAWVCIVTDTEPPATPCGACRQWIFELGTPDLKITTANLNGSITHFTISELLPHSFTLKEVKK